MPSLTLDEIFAESAEIDTRMQLELPVEPEPVSARVVPVYAAISVKVVFCARQSAKFG